MTFGDSRLDFLVNESLYLEVKSSNLLIGPECRFPDAPTERGAKHLRELMAAKEAGFDAGVVILGLRRCDCFRAHAERDPVFAKTLEEALNAGVRFYGVKGEVLPEEKAVVYRGSLKICQ